MLPSTGSVSEWMAFEVSVSFRMVCGRGEKERRIFLWLVLGEGKMIMSIPSLVRVCGCIEIGKRKCGLLSDRVIGDTGWGRSAMDMAKVSWAEGILQDAEWY